MTRYSILQLILGQVVRNPENTVEIALIYKLQKINLLVTCSWPKNIGQSSETENWTKAKYCRRL